MTMLMAVYLGLIGVRRSHTCVAWVMDTLHYDHRFAFFMSVVNTRYILARLADCYGHTLASFHSSPSSVHCVRLFGIALSSRNSTASGLIAMIAKCS